MSSDRHRGPHPEDAATFAPDALPSLREGVADLSWLLTRGYREASALKLVGDRLQLTRRQRQAVARCACTDQERNLRRGKRVAGVEGQVVHVDGFNALISLERALSGGPVLIGRDRACRDLASVHGTYRAVQETPEAITCCGAHLAGAERVQWWLDRPVSNSGRLAAQIRALADDRGWPWAVEVVGHPDPHLAEADGLVVSSDGWILDRCQGWFDLEGSVLADLDEAWVVDLDPG